MTTFDPSRHAGHPGQSRRHLPGLDGIRGLAILMVIFSHFITVGENLGKGTAFSNLLHSGYLGVDLFFVLSGFLITGILIDSKNSPNYFGAFYMRRALRIFPLYYGLLAVAWLTVVFITPQDKADLTGVDSMAWFWFYAPNIGIAVKGQWLNAPTWVGLGHFWSLAVEEQFYLVWPLVVYLTPVRILKWGCVILVLASPLVFRELMEWFGGGKSPEQIVTGARSAYVSTLGRLGVLAGGSWMAIIWRDPKAWNRLEPKLIWLALVSGVLLLLERTYFLKWMFGFEGILALILGAACVGLAAGGSGGRALQGFFESPVLRWLGKYSYGIYVYHHALKPVWIRFLWEGWIVKWLGEGWAATIAYTIAATAASLALAWLSWKWFESPILSLKSKFAYRSGKVDDPGASPNRTN